MEKLVDLKNYTDTHFFLELPPMRCNMLENPYYVLISLSFRSTCFILGLRAGEGEQQAIAS